jgi:hypothetical protein
MAKGAKVRVYGDWDGSAIKKAEKDVNSFGSNVKKSFAAVGVAIAGAFALTEVTRFLKDAAQAAAEDEKSMVALAKSMENLGLATQNAGVEDFIKQLMLATGAADDALRPAMSRLLLVTGDVATSQRALQIAMDVSAGTGRDLDSITTALAKAYGGQTTALQRLAVGLDSATLKSRDMDLITGELAAKFEGQAAAAADTYGGKLLRLQTAAGEAQETIGYALLGALDALANSLGGTDGAVALVTSLGDRVAGVVTKFGDMALAARNGVTVLQENSRAVAIATTAIVALTAAMVANRIGGIGFALQYAAHTVQMGAFTIAANAATIATRTLTAAMRLVPFVAVATALAVLVTELDKGAEESIKLRDQVYRTAKAARDLKDANGELAQSTINAAKWGRFHRGVLTEAATATKIYANEALFAAGATDTQILAIRNLIGTLSGYVPMALAAADAANALRGSSAETARYTGLAKSLGAEIGWGARGLQKYNAYMADLEDKTKKAGGAKKDLKDKTVAIDASMRSTLRSVNRTAMSYDDLTRSLGGDDIAAFSRKMLATGEITSKTKDEFEDMVSTIRDRLNVTLDAAKQKLGEWQAKYDNTLRTVSDGIRSGNGIADAANAQAEATRALADAQRQYDEALKSKDAERIAETGSALEEARKQQGTFLTFLKRGADSAEAFGDQIQQLIRANAALEVVQDIAAMGARTGSRIAAELLAGGAAAIEQANRMVTAVGKAALDAGTLAAQTFYGAGLASAQAYVTALETQVRPLLQALLNQIAAQISAALKVPVNANIGGGGPAPEPAPTPAATPAPFVPILTPQQFKATTAVRPPSGEGRIWAEIRAFAEGGIVKSPTFGVIGEAGPEAIIPLSEMRNMNGSTTVNVTVNAGMGTNGAEVGRQIVDALAAYSRRNGPLPLAVS